MTTRAPPRRGPPSSQKAGHAEAQIDQAVKSSGVWTTRYVSAASSAAPGCSFDQSAVLAASGQLVAFIAVRIVADKRER